MNRPPPRASDDGANSPCLRSSDSADSPPPLQIFTSSPHPGSSNITHPTPMVAAADVGGVSNEETKNNGTLKSTRISKVAIDQLCEYFEKKKWPRNQELPRSINEGELFEIMKRHGLKNLKYRGNCGTTKQGSTKTLKYKSC